MANIQLKHISYSMMTLWNNCRECWKYKYIMLLKGETPPVFLAGQEYHEEVDKYHKGFPYNKSLIKPYTNVFPVDYRKKSEVWISDFGGIYLTLGKVKTPLPVKGKIDGICDGFLADLKYMSGRMSQRQADESDQATLYLWWYYTKFKKIVPFVYNCVDKKTNKVALVKTKRTTSDFCDLSLKMDKFVKEVEIAFKTNNFTGGNGCYPGCCEFIKLCSNCQRSKYVR